MQKVLINSGEGREFYGDSFCKINDIFTSGSSKPIKYIMAVWRKYMCSTEFG